jgi:L-ascorbate metabolism protein UlaG (beta-lactamase superfamily)
MKGIAAIGCAALAIFAARGEPPRVEVFEPGVLSAGEVYRGAFSPDGGTFYFFRKTGPEEDYRIFSSHPTPGGWTSPAVVDLGGAHSDLYPAISRDGRRMVFSSYRPVPGQTSGRRSAHLWYADRTAGGWSEPVFMARANTLGHYHSWVEFGFDGALYFRRSTPDWKRTDTMRARWTGSEYSAPAPYADVERWKSWRPDVDIVGGSPGPDGRLVFLDVATRNRRTGRPASDIWVSLRRGETWTEPAPLGDDINSEGYDVFPFLSPDGRDLYFVRDFSTFYRTSLESALASVGAVTGARYVANAGMLISLSGRRFLIDAPIRDGIPPYAVSSAAERALLEAARPPYHQVDAILVTHWHEDHFSADAVAAYLANSPGTIFLSSPEVVERLRMAAPHLPEARLRAVLPAPGQHEQIEVAGVPISVLRLRHNPSRRFPEQHVGFLMGRAGPVLHVGDADPAPDNFAVLKSLPPVDVALLPFWYLTSDRNAAIVADAIRPRHIVAMHVPPGDAHEIRTTLAAASFPFELASVPGSSLTVRH